MPKYKNLLLTSKRRKSKSKKRKLVQREPESLFPVNQEIEEDEDETGFKLKIAAPSQEHGVQPLGNLYFNPGSVNVRNTGLVMSLSGGISY
ncbi:PREDICTED: F-box protein At5g06550-like [Camelina sativa]|uniref:F-box protein At5g06550-like n=1 Tax=Camelina sativa TaxID=90675 RepID=A0ABM0TAI9_CAMSA|nr:PREDICTED: F-box protein At5g06550-like [Camelina sativa]